MESPGIKMLKFPGLESPGKRHRSWKTLEKSWHSKVVVLKMLISGTSFHTPPPRRLGPHVVSSQIPPSRMSGKWLWVEWGSI